MLRTKEERRAKSELWYNLSHVIIDDTCTNDDDFFQRLLWANQWISNQLMSFEDVKIPERDEIS